MSLFSFLDMKAADEFAREISEEFANNFPVKMRDDAKAEQRLAHAIEVLGNRAAKFDKQTPLGFFRKSRFMNAVKKELLARGHAAEVVDRVLYAAVVRMARR